MYHIVIISIVVILTIYFFSIYYYNKLVTEEIEDQIVEEELRKTKTIEEINEKAFELWYQGKTKEANELQKIATYLVPSPWNNLERI